MNPCSVLKKIIPSLYSRLGDTVRWYSNPESINLRSRDKVVVLDLDILFLRSKTGFCILIINYNTKENNLVSAHKVKRIYLVFSGMPKTKTKKNASKFLFFLRKLANQNLNLLCTSVILIAPKLFIHVSQTFSS